jgi:hypothetical protein
LTASTLRTAFVQIPSYLPAFFFLEAPAIEAGDFMFPRGLRTGRFTKNCCRRRVRVDS